jgi:hypothetical protein
MFLKCNFHSFGGANLKMGWSKVLLLRRQQQQQPLKLQFLRTAQNFLQYLPLQITIGE